MSNLPSDLLIPLFDDPNEGFEAPINVNTHSVAAAGFYPQNATSANKDAGIYRDSEGNLVLKDYASGTKTLTQIVSGSANITFGSPLTIGSSNADGIAVTAARSDHVHALPTVGTAGTYGSAAQVPVFVTDANGRVSSVTNTSISVTSAAVSDFSSATKTVLGTSVSSGTGISTSVNPTTGVLTISNAGVISVNGSTGVVTGLVATNDSRLSDARTPTTHASSHASAGSDPLTLAQSQVTNLTTDLAAKASINTTISAGTGLTGGGDLSTNRTISMPSVGTSGTYGSGSSVPVFTTDAQGRVSSVTNTAISIASSAVSDFSTAVRTVLGTSVSAGTGISTSVNPTTGVLTVSNAGVTSVNGGTGAVTNVALTTGKLSQFASTTSSELAGVLSDETGSGALVFGTAPTLAQVTLSAGTTTTVPLKFTSGTNLTTAVAGAVEWDGTSLYLTQTSGPTRKTVAYTDSNITGNAATATKLSASKTFALTGDITGSVSTDLTSGPSIATTHGSLSGASMHAAATALANGFMPSADKSKLDAATNANTASTLVMRDASGNFSAGTITAALSGNASTATTATKLSSARSFALTGDVTGSVSSDLTSGASIATTLANSGVVAATYGSASQVPVLVVDAKGRLTSVTNTSIAVAQSAVTNLTSDLSSRPTGSGTSGQIAYWSGTSTLTSESALTWDATNNRLGIGTTPSTALDVQATGGTTARIISTSNTSATYPALQVWHYTGGFGGHPVMQMYAARGTQASPAALSNGDYLGACIWYGTNTSLTYSEAARMSVITDAAPGASNVNGAITFNTSSNGVSTERVRIDSTGLDLYNGSSVTVFGSALSSSAGSVVNGFSLSSNTGSNEYVSTYIKRRTAGSTSASADMYVQRGVLFGASAGHVVFPGSGGVSLGHNDTDHLILNSSGSVGIGTTPSGNTKLLVAGDLGMSSGYGILGNTYYSGSSFYYISSAAATCLSIGSGVFSLQTAPSGTGGNAATMTTRLYVSPTYAQFTSHVYPASNNTYALGSSGQAWSDVWSNRGAFNGSDARIKNSIEDSDRGLAFIEALRPRKYKLNIGRCEVVVGDDGSDQIIRHPGTRPHYGFIAQEVKAVIDASSEGDFAGYAYAPDSDSHWLTYEEFIAPLVKAVQELSQQNKDLRSKLDLIEARLLAIESK